MNTLILTDDQLLPDQLAKPTARQSEHIETTLRLGDTDKIAIGLLNGNLGSALIKETPNGLFLSDIQLDRKPPSSLPLTLILALPRPQMLKRILQTVACFGVQKIVLIQSNRVEKSFWQSPSAQADAMRDQLILGLEQANATQLPEILTFKQFKIFIEDFCPELTQSSDKYLLHPGPYPFMPCGSLTRPTTIAIGPEGGFTEYETRRWFELGFQGVQFGQRILRVETAVTAALARCIG